MSAKTGRCGDAGIRTSSAWGCRPTRPGVVVRPFRGSATLCRRCGMAGMSAALWACLRLKAPALAAVRRRLAQPSPWLAVTDGPGNRPQVLACAKAAMQAGVRPGLSVPAARALCPQVVTTPRDPAAEQALRELLGAWAYGFSDQVTLALPDAVAFEVGGSLRLFRGWPQLERQLRSDLDTLGFEAALAVGPRPRAAWVFAGCN